MKKEKKASSLTVRIRFRQSLGRSLDDFSTRCNIISLLKLREKHSSSSLLILRTSNIAHDAIIN